MAKVYLIICFTFLLTANCFNSGGDAGATQITNRPADVGAETKPGQAFPVDLAPAPAAQNPEDYRWLLQGKRLGLVVNQTSTVGQTHLVDTLLALGQQVAVIFAPEHGFRGEADAGATIADGLDARTGLPIRSLYGSNKKPSAEDLENVDLIVFDIQDVGARFYTYISTLHYVMESAARYGKPVVILDRPNPNGHYVDGPVRRPGFESFVGLDPIPVVHGLTVGEYGKMVNGEGWLGEGLTCDLTVVPCRDYTHDSPYELPVAPSPNLPNQRSIYLYPSLCFFEGTALSVGRGTDKQFQVYGHPQLEAPFTFTPRPGPGAADPKLNGEVCHGYDLTNTPAVTYRENQLNLQPLLSTHGALTDAGVSFFTRPDFFDLLAGTDRLRKMIAAGESEEAIRASWADELAAYRAMRDRYLLYP
ncbi:uncharacterized protein YbbC (DUF1343 family) [Neolewinella xylanilytica]|uniref:Uncharacterized protein YbbC (DUF1343 family) n=1 Tax=Neolewinella xylanilytica TaxID=1514080 RepID=A0A2S6I9T6_9BACT|nr:DUF1343 domain-containing protein [Neolewinella xylanilytica]PPK88264.1 uncharacterized protein YbbC (DUF1343 family) [Neolewinella xylanilytica]